MLPQQKHPGSELGKESRKQDEQANRVSNFIIVHTNFKAQLRNKRYIKSLNNLLKIPLPEENHQVTYYQDTLIAIIKIIRASITSKQNNIVEFLKQYYQKGVQNINKLYGILHRDKYYIHKNMSYFLALTIDFTTNIAMAYHSNHISAAPIIFSNGYLLAESILASSTSNVRVIKKCVQFYLVYSNYLSNTGQYQLSLKIILQALKIQLNEIHILKMLERIHKKVFHLRKKQKKAYLRLRDIFIVIAILSEKTFRTKVILDILNQILNLEKYLFPKNRVNYDSTDILKKYLNAKNQRQQLLHITKAYFNEQHLKLQIQINQQIQNQTKQHKEQSKGKEQQTNNDIIIERNYISKQRQSIKYKSFSNTVTSRTSILTANEKHNHDKILLYGDNFWENKSKNSKSSLYETNANQTLNSKWNIIEKYLKSKTKPKLKKKKINNIQNYPIIQARKQKDMSKFYQQTFSPNENHKYNSYQKVCEKINNFQQIKNVQQLFFKQKISKLKKRKVGISAKLKQFQEQKTQEILFDKDKSITSNTKPKVSSLNNHHHAKLQGIKLLKNIILKHKTEIGITKNQIFSHWQTEQKKKANIGAPLLESSQKIDQTQRLKQKAFNEAKNNISFYLKAYANKCQYKVKIKARVQSQGKFDTKGSLLVAGGLNNTYLYSNLEKIKTNQ